MGGGEERVAAGAPFDDLDDSFAWLVDLLDRGLQRPRQHFATATMPETHADQVQQP